MNVNDKILICYSEPTKFYNNYLGKDVSDSKENVDLSESEFSTLLVLLENSLKEHFFNVESFGVGPNIRKLIDKIYEYSPDVIFNFVESVEGNANLESYVAGVYEILGVQYTGNSALALGNCLIKSRTKQILQSYGIKTPEYMIVTPNSLPSRDGFTLKFPVIVKLLREDASIGISEFSVANDFDSALKRIKYLLENYKQEILVEEYIDGRELNVSILGGKVLPISEITFDGLPKAFPKIVTYEAKWSPESIYYKNTIPKCPAIISDNIRERIEKTALEAFNAMDCRDYARVDVRLSKRNVPYVIEVNPNPDISPDAGFVRSAQAAGYSYSELLKLIASFALKRKNYDTQAAV